jgi:hypothetical protein
MFAVFGTLTLKHGSEQMFVFTITQAPSLVWALIYSKDPKIISSIVIVYVFAIGFSLIHFLQRRSQNYDRSVESRVESQVPSPNQNSYGTITTPPPEYTPNAYPGTVLIPVRYHTIVPVEPD